MVATEKGMNDKDDKKRKISVQNPMKGPSMEPSAMDKTVKYTGVELPAKVNQRREILFSVYKSLAEKGYNPINQIVGYLLSGDPAYIPRHNNARNLIRQLERDELLEELVRSYLETYSGQD